MNFLSDLTKLNSENWEKKRRNNALNLFSTAAKKVPAYKDFLHKNKINPNKIKTFEDFQLVPPITKKDYLRQYELRDLVWEGDLKKPLVFTSTTGSTGEPFYFPRSNALDKQYALLAEMFLRNGYRGEQ